MTSLSDSQSSSSLLVQIASYNTNLQGSTGTPQDLVDWLSPTLSTSHTQSPPDIVAVGFQELLPLHLGRKRRMNYSRHPLIIFVLSYGPF